MKILVTGGYGMIGSELKKYAPIGTLFFGHNEEPSLDVLDLSAARGMVLSHRPDVIIHLAGETDVDWCERTPEDCHEINVKGTENMVKITAEAGAVFIYPSTFYVYTGKKDGYYDDRTDEPEADKIVSVYARSKFAAEEIIRRDLKKYFILRLGALFGGGRKDKKFVSKILGLIRKKKEVRVVSDRIVQPSSIKDTVNNILELAKTSEYNTYNMVGHGSASYYEYAKEIVRCWGADDIKVIPIRSVDFKEDAPRQMNLSVINGRLQDIGLDLMRDWKVALKDYITEIKKERLI